MFLKVLLLYRCVKYCTYQKKCLRIRLYAGIGTVLLICCGFKHEFKFGTGTTNNLGYFGTFWVAGAATQIATAPAPKVYKYKVFSTSFIDDIYGIEIINLQERLHVLVNILAMGSLV
jgi:hypothetical protein